MTDLNHWHIGSLIFDDEPIGTKDWEPVAFGDAARMEWLSIRGICRWHYWRARSRRFRFEFSDRAWWLVRERDGKIVCGHEYEKEAPK